MRLATLKRRHYNVTKPDYERILVILLTDFLWCNERLKILSETLTEIEAWPIIGDRLVKRVQTETGKYLSNLPEWAKMQIIMDNPENGKFLGELTGDTKTMWQLMK